MPDKLKQIDTMLAKMCVSGENVMIVAAVRTMLNELYKEALKEVNQ